MVAEEAVHIREDGAALALRIWRPRAVTRGVVQIIHGLAEHAGRYAWFAHELTQAGWVVYAQDLPGHGRSAAPGELGFFGATGGWRACLDDIESVNRRISASLPNAPIVLFGHSMGSFLAQDYISGRRTPDAGRLAGVALSGSNGPPPLLASLGRLIARVERLRVGPQGVSPLLMRMMFGAFNKKFRPNRTKFDWLTRDQAMVDAYIADPLCGFDVSTQLVIDLLDALDGLSAPSRIKNIPADLPIYILSGACDPVGVNLTSLIEMYRAAGLNVTAHLYPDGRHEMINEIDRMRVVSDFINWIDGLPT